jgi:hypothetical protein
MESTTDPGNHQLPLLPFINEAGKSSFRSRLNVLLIVVASVIVLLTLWNLRDGSWLKQRLRLVRDIERWRLWDSTQAMPAVSQEEQEGYAEAKTFVSLYHVTSIERAEYFRTKMEDIRIDHLVAMQLPFFGCYFDVNDLGLVAAVSFTILLIMMRFSLVNEVANVQIVLAQAVERGAVGESYQLLRMKQVLTSPGEKLAFFRHLPKTILFLPITCQLIILIHDLCTFSVGTMYTLTGTMVVLAAQFVLLGAVVFLTVLCVWLSMELDRIWDQFSARRDIQKGREVPRPL